MKLVYLFAWCWFIGALVTGCTTTYYPSGRKSACIGSNVGHFALTSGTYRVTMDGVDNAIIHQKAGDTVSKTGVAVATSGILGLFGGITK